MEKVIGKREGDHEMSITRGNIYSVDEKKLDKLQSEQLSASMAVGDLNVVLELMMEPALSESKYGGTDWVSMVSVLKRIAKDIDETLTEIERTISEFEIGSRPKGAMAQKT
jgi:hypothetical protein